MHILIPPHMIIPGQVSLTPSEVFPPPTVWCLNSSLCGAWLHMTIRPSIYSAGQTQCTTRLQKTQCVRKRLHETGHVCTAVNELFIHNPCSHHLLISFCHLYQGEPAHLYQQAPVRFHYCLKDEVFSVCKLLLLYDLEQRVSEQPSGWQEERTRRRCITRAVTPSETYKFY